MTASRVASGKASSSIIPFRFRREYLFQALVLQRLDIIPWLAEGDIEGGHDLLPTWVLYLFCPDLSALFHQVTDEIQHRIEERHWSFQDE
jgi:hypothetical protein